MIEIKLTDTEANELVKLLSNASDEFSKHICNDYILPNTDECWELNQKVMYTVNGYDSIEEWMESEGEDNERPESDNRICLYDWMLYDYFSTIIENELKNNGCRKH